MFDYLYTLQDKTPVKCHDVATWARWFETSDRIVKYDHTKVKDEFVIVSTVFLGINHSITTPRPLLFETMIFGGEFNRHSLKCSTWDEAIKQHETVLALIKIEDE